MAPRRRAVRILAAIPHEKIRSSLRVLISDFEDLDIVGEVVSSIEALRLMNTLHPDVLPLGFRLADIDGVSIARLLLQQPHPPFIIMLDDAGSDEHRQAALIAGANLYFSQDVPAYAIIDAIHASAQPLSKPAIAPSQAMTA